MFWVGTESPNKRMSEVAIKAQVQWVKFVQNINEDNFNVKFDKISRIFPCLEYDFEQVGFYF